MSMHSRKYLRIEGDLATLVTEVTEREVALDDLLSRLAEQRSACGGVLPAGCRFWVRSPEGREVFVVEQLPMRRQIEYHASRRCGTEHDLGSRAAGVDSCTFSCIVLVVGPEIVHQTLHRSLPHGLKDVVGELELRGTTLVSADQIAAYGGVAPRTPAAYDLVHRLIAARWLRPLPVRGRYEFLPGRAGPFSREDTLDPLRALLAEHGLQAQVALSGAAFLRGFADRAPLAFDVLVPRNRRISTSLRSLYRFHWVAPDRIFGAEPLEGLPVSTRERLLLDVALWPNEVGGGLRARDHWLGPALATAATDRVVEMLRQLDSNTATARAGYLADAFGRPDLADAIAGLGRSRVAVPLLPGAEATPAARHHRRFNVVDPLGAATVA